MPRKRPSVVRGEIPVRISRRRYPPVNGVSGACQAAMRRLDRRRFWPEATAEAFWHWSALAHGTVRQITDRYAWNSCGVPECGCDPAHFRGLLETALCALPKAYARELRPLVRRLDERILAKAKVIRADSPDDPWWLRRPP
ncbi:hypothetical protein [Streptomyces sp. 891-h]|uniref:hypothetical protein n=1 Tax=unclassified Streptomyces TaxID=2593676 RepID=UPI001FAAB0A9|nr:hypothetical protein [Streptomyces sp. 891-h]UNZ18630.1 hypothetical protein HC362_17940 [Streptomyces sp. 891-h]